MSLDTFENKHVKQLGFLSILFFIASIFVFALPAWADTNVSLKVGQYTQKYVYEYSNFNASGYNGDFSYSTVEDNYKISSSNPKVATAIYWSSTDRSGKYWGISENVTAYLRILGKSAGSATITLSRTWTSRECPYERQFDGSYLANETTKTESKKYIFKVSVSKNGVIKASACDGLFKGKKYSVKNLFRNVAFDCVNSGMETSGSEDNSEDFDITYDAPASDKAPSVLSGGKFLKGKGYKVYSKGKKIKFTKSGKIVVKYKAGKTKYKITCSKIRTLAAFKKAAKKEIKEHLFYPSTFKIKKTTFHWDKEVGRYYATVKFSAKSIYGSRRTESIDVYYDDGYIACNYCGLESGEFDAMAEG